MNEDVYSLIEEQYQSLVHDVEQCQEAVNHLNIRLDHQDIRIAEFAHKLSLTEAIALGVTVKDLLRSVRSMEEQLDDLMHLEKCRILGKGKLYEDFRK